jgi:hypothetical protein
VGENNMSIPIVMGFPLTAVSPMTPAGVSFDTGAFIVDEKGYGIRTCYYSPTPILYTNHGSLMLLCGNEVRNPKNALFFYLPTSDILSTS